MSQDVEKNIPEALADRKETYCDRSYKAEIDKLSSIDSRISFQATMIVIQCSTLYYIYKNIFPNSYGIKTLIYICILITLATISVIIAIILLSHAYRAYKKNGWEYAYVYTPKEIMGMYYELIKYYKYIGQGDVESINSAKDELNIQLNNRIAEAAHINFYINRKRIKCLTYAAAFWVGGYIFLLSIVPVCIYKEIKAKSNVDNKESSVIVSNGYLKDIKSQFNDVISSKEELKLKGIEIEKLKNDLKELQNLRTEVEKLKILENEVSTLKQRIENKDDGKRTAKHK